MKKLFATLLALAMILAMSATAFAADEPETFTLTITGATGHTYDIYQIYTGDVSQEGDKTVLSNVKYGLNHFPVDGKVGNPVPADELATLIASQKPADILDSAVTGTPFKDDVTPVKGESVIEITNIPTGYYMIVDVSPELPAGETKSPIMLQVLESVTIASKHATIVSTKKVDDKNDSTTAEDKTEWHDVADYDIGDNVPFRLTVTLPSTLNGYESYELTFHDNQAAGFNAPENFNVYILKKDGTTKIAIPATSATVTNGYTVEACTSDKCEYGKCTFTVKVGNVKALYGTNTFEDGDMIVVEYTSKLNNTANVGKTGNENSMYVCHPDGHTPMDTVTVLTYELKINKIDGTTKEALTGAGFTLYKWNAAEGAWKSVGDEVKNVTTFSWSGIDGGNYKLVETTTPVGYNSLAEIEFTVDANHKTDWTAGFNAAFLDLIAKNAAGDIVFGDGVTVDGTLVEDGVLEGNVENYKGTVLPETGAEGTFFLITCGTLLIMVATVFMITRKKMSVYED